MLQVCGTRIRGSADDVHTAILVPRELLDRVRPEIWVHGGSIHPEPGEDRECVGPHRVAHVAALAVEEKRSAWCFIAELQQRLPAVWTVLLPEGAIGFEAAHVLLRLAHHLAAVPQRAGCAALDALGVGVEADAEQGAPVLREH